MIGWQVKEDHLTLIWEESGGPLVRTPKSRGFGTRSLLASVESQLGGQAQFDWRAEGLLCRLEVPLTRKTPTAAAQGKFDAATSLALQRASG
jgi:two-component sensor histidine kinase